MNLSKYIGMPYDLRNVNGLNCWSLVALVYKELFDCVVTDYQARDHRAVHAAFTAAFAKGNHGFIKVSRPLNFDVVVMFTDKPNPDKNQAHCGIYYDGKVLHANRGANQVSYDRFKDAIFGFKVVEFWRKSHT